MRNRKGQGLSLQTIVLVILAVIVLIVVVIIFQDQIKSLYGALGEMVKNAVGLSESTKVDVGG